MLRVRVFTTTTWECLLDIELFCFFHIWTEGKVKREPWSNWLSLGLMPPPIGPEKQDQEEGPPWLLYEGTPQVPPWLHKIENRKFPYM